MERKISYLIFLLLKFLDKITIKIFNKSFFKWFNLFINQDCYQEINILKKKIIFFSPNHISNWRIETFFSKEPETLEWINNFKKKKFIFWDIGANVGLYSIYAAVKHSKCTVISFEPSTSNLRILSRNIFINKLCKKIFIFNNPLVDDKNANKFLDMNESEFIEGHALNTFGKKINFEGKALKSKMKYKLFGTSINHILKNKYLSLPDYIKIDVDGIEHLILQGGDKFLKNKKIKSLLVEINENFFDQHTKIIKLMKRYKFKLLHKKKRDELIDRNDKFFNTYNYIFKR